jgi:protein gp37
MMAEWVRSIRDQCMHHRVPFHFKQWGGTNKKITGRVLDGRTWDELPKVFLSTAADAQYTMPV